MWPFKPKKDKILLELLELSNSEYAIRKTTINPNGDIEFKYLNLRLYQRNRFDIYFRDVFHMFLHSLKCSKHEAQRLFNNLSCGTSPNKLSSLIKTVGTRVIQ